MRPDILVQLAVPKSTGTHADVLAAVGLADLLTDPSGQPVRLVEQPGAFVLHLPDGLSQEYLDGLPVGPGYPFLQTGPNVQVPLGAEDAVDYKDEARRVKEYRKLREQSTRGGNKPPDAELQERLMQLQPRTDWRLLQVMNTLQGDENSNKAHAAIVTASMEQRREWINAGVSGLAGGLPCQAPWKANLVQVFTPSAAKGYARLKPDGTSRGDKTKDQWADPFLEWMKYRGYFRVASPYFFGSKAEHIRLLCPVPADISVTALCQVAELLRHVWTGRRDPSKAKLDSMAVLSLARLLIEHSAEYHEADVPAFPGLEIAGRSPAQLISGVMITHYQSMGSAKAVSEMSTLALPDWFPIAGQEAAQAWLGILEEHRRALRSLDDSHSDEIGLLLQYRQFLERRGDRALLALLEFMGTYGQFLIRARERNRRPTSFTTTNLRRIIDGMNQKYTEILDDPGFAAVAAAVRRATVSAQAQKANRRRDYREIRYDLIPELRRKRTLTDSKDFIETVADFVSSYNVENARRREMGRPAPANVTTEQFMAFCRQVEESGASLVGALLCAYGSCRVPYAGPREEGEEAPEAARAAGETDIAEEEDAENNVAQEV